MIGVIEIEEGFGREHGEKENSKSEIRIFRRVQVQVQVGGWSRFGVSRRC
jgi:hypothetical protein